MYLVLIGKKNFHTYLISDQEANKCKTMFKNLITAHPDDELHEAYFGLAKIYFHLNRLDAAYDCIFKAAQIRPTDQVYLLWKGLILFYIVSIASLDYFQNSKKE
jgi:tetratricopeptide (TPR) repeat protein